MIGIWYQYHCQLSIYPIFNPIIEGQGTIPTYHQRGGPPNAQAAFLRLGQWGWLKTIIYICMYACMYVCMHVCMYACMHVCMYACMHVCMYACMHACMHVCMYACMHVCMYACMHACMHVCMYECMYVWMNECMYVYMYIYIHIYLFVYTHFFGCASHLVSGYHDIYLYVGRVQISLLFIHSDPPNFIISAIKRWCMWYSYHSGNNNLNIVMTYRYSIVISNGGHKLLSMLWHLLIKLCSNLSRGCKMERRSSINSLAFSSKILHLFPSLPPKLTPTISNWNVRNCCHSRSVLQTN